MNAIIISLICALCWGVADLFYKAGTDNNDKHSHLKIAVWVGIAMVIMAVCCLPMSESHSSLGELFSKYFITYSPASVSYIVSMVIGYAGLRYLEVSIVSPVQNASGAFSAIAMVIYFTFFGKGNLWDEVSVIDIIGSIIIAAGIIALGIVEQKLSNKELDLTGENKKYRFGALALIFPILYCIFDTIGTSFDGVILEGKHGLGLGENDVLVLYGLTFFVAGIGCWLFMLIRNKKPYNPFKKSEIKKGAAATAEIGGQIFYVYAMAKNPVISAIVVSSYCIISVILSRIFLKEKLVASQYACVITVILGIILLGVSEGIGEM
ncbi:MAG: EamA family transporter [Clostridia bacterium]|nr:EamA family transporter [Clostridia bacterium]